MARLIRGNLFRRCGRSTELGRKRIGILHSETGFADLCRIGSGETRELRSHVIYDVKVAVRPVVVTQAKIRTHVLCVCRIQLNDASESQKPIKRIVRLQARQIDREVSLWQSESVPYLRS